MKKLIIVVFIIVIVVGILVYDLTRKNSSKNFELDYPEELVYQYFVMYSGDKAGVIDRTGKILIEPKYQDIFIPNQSKDVFFVNIDEDRNKILNKDGKEVFKDFEEVTYLETSEPTELVLEKNVLRYKENNMYGLMDLDGNKITEAIYERVSSLTNKPGNILVKKEGLCGVLNSKGQEIIEVKYNSIVGDDFCLEAYGYALSGYIVSIKTDTGIMYGYIDYKGDELLKTEYETITRVLEYDDKDDIYLVVRNNGKKGVFKNGKQIIEFDYQYINYADKSNIFIVEKFGKYGFFTNKGNEILEPKYTKYAIAGNYISVEKEGENKLFDLNGNLINTDTYLSMIEVENSSYFIAVKENGYYSVISKEFQREGNYVFISYAFDDLFIVTTEDGKTGILDVWNGFKIEPIYDSILNAQGTKILVARNDETGDVDIYNSKLEKVSTINGGIVENLDNNYVVVYSNSQMQYFDKEGKIVSNTEIFPNRELYSIQNEEGKWGFSDNKGNVIVPCEYDIVSEFNEYGFSAIKKDGKWGSINSNGEIVLEPNNEIETYYFPIFVGKYLLEYTETKHCIEVDNSNN